MRQLLRLDRRARIVRKWGSMETMTQEPVTIDDAVLQDESRMEDWWLEAMEAGKPAADFSAAAKKLAEAGKKEFALTLLNLLSGHFKSDARAELLIQKEIFRMDKTPENLKKLISFYEKVFHAKLHDVSALIPEKKSDDIVQMLEKCLYFTDAYFYDDLLDTGKVVEIFPARGELVIAYKTQKQTYAIGSEEIKELEKLPPEHFQVLKYESPEKLKALAAASPAELIKLILRSYDRVTEEKIKSLLNHVVDDFSGWWKKVKLQLKKETDIRASEGMKKYYSLVSREDMQAHVRRDFEDADVLQKLKLLREYKDNFPGLYPLFLETLKNEAENGSGGAAQAFTVLFSLFEMKAVSHQDLLKKTEVKSARELMDVVLEISSKKHKKMLMDELFKKGGEIHELFAPAARLDEEIFSYFLERAGEKRAEALEHFYSAYRIYPEKFLHLVRYAKETNGHIDKETTLKILEVLYKEKELRKNAAELVDVEKLDVQELSREEAAQVRTHAEDIFLYDAGTRRKLKKLLYKYHPYLLPNEEELIYATREAIAKKEEELRQIKSVDIPKNSEEIERARAFGDFSENHEYKAAKERHGMLFTRVKQLENELSRAVPVEEGRTDGAVVSVGKKVTVCSENETQTYAILGVWDSAPDRHIISYKSQIACMLLGKAVGESVEIDGKIFEIKDIADELG